MPRQPSHDAETSLRQLPVRLAPHPDELLSSWIGRHAAFYAVPPLAMLRHGLPEASSLHAADRSLNGDQVIRLAGLFSTEPAVVRRTTFSNIAPSSRRLIAARPLQFCSACHPGEHEPRPLLRSQFLGWRITCPLCGDLFRCARGHDRPSPFDRHQGAALVGERLLDDEAERGVRTWTSPAEIARLLLMRRVPRPLPREYEPWRFRVLGAIIPDLDDVVERRSLPTPANPVLPLHLRPALLAGVAIVERAGPEMLEMLRGQMMGQNQARFSSAIDEITTHTCRSMASSQLQLI
ncbi:TniQ family protein [Pseudorhizobium flavum]|uniref:TniQ family protein n=1 Tax=Pseudorhizobium flavum TaxID=1335061 RepID=UPI00376F63D0